MDLSLKTKENIEYMIAKILEKLKIINVDAVNPKHFNDEQYDEIFDIYQLVMKRPSFSPREMQAIVEELGTLRKQ
ncbi:DUF1128 domain-containing protein [Caldibacillus lycopersici]|uniref:UPF0435 protein OEV98_13275 n=1 Tax=Perspicuibacillus lycopersici TaxID=1325689 RepID=A0AAE3IW62_9BACI|nr:DUF1128 domain-containing protein [Perspicuibacillus lycopersici]MCU9614511.1 DUF1128 domain-containing protein [Perspicuibacillus lycopersici]